MEEAEQLSCSAVPPPPAKVQIVFIIQVRRLIYGTESGEIQNKMKRNEKKHHKRFLLLLFVDHTGSMFGSSVVVCAGKQDETSTAVTSFFVVVHQGY